MSIVKVISVKYLENDGWDWFEVTWFDGDMTAVDIFGLTEDFILLDAEGYALENAWFARGIKDALLEKHYVNLINIKNK